MRGQLLGVSKKEISRSIASLSRFAQFAVVFGVDSKTEKFPGTGKAAQASAHQKKEAARFLKRVAPTGRSQLEEDLRQGLKLAAALESQDRVLIYVGDGQVFSKDPPALVLGRIRALNTARVPIHVVGITPYSRNVTFLKQLALENGGTYRQVDS